ncbi:hypothetical protein RND71_012564 [Anisodus tanguticus]|uniref:Uncharacterized protein n=1 Tax=Anisodus tanguticus TaxID=243964 RepID=A0AAE1SFQ2_9SOLA|nr:hypothetical protein RND71_012564 [Anisodus tanguticus]
MPENNMDINGSETVNGSFMDPMLGVNGKFPLELDTFSPDLQIEWKSALMDDDIGELPSLHDSSGLVLWSSPPFFVSSLHRAEWTYHAKSMLEMQTPQRPSQKGFRTPRSGYGQQQLKERAIIQAR